MALPPSAFPPAPFQELTGDEAILNYIFNPGTGFIGGSDPDAVPSGAKPAKPDMDAAAADDVATKEAEAVAKAEAGNVDEALEAINVVVAAAPDRPSVYNNRAQVLRLKDDVPGAKADLDKAVELGEAWLDAHADAPSTEVRRVKDVLAQSLTQRSILHHKDGDEEARDADIRRAAAFGNRLARMVTAEQNPYATMCHTAVDSMISDATGVVPVTVAPAGSGGGGAGGAGGEESSSAHDGVGGGGAAE